MDWLILLRFQGYRQNDFSHFPYVLLRDFYDLKIATQGDGNPYRNVKTLNLTGHVVHVMHRLCEFGWSQGVLWDGATTPQHLHHPLFLFKREQDLALVSYLLEKECF
jgi:hypothetical protein